MKTKELKTYTVVFHKRENYIAVVEASSANAAAYTVKQGYLTDCEVEAIGGGGLPVVDYVRLGDRINDKNDGSRR